MPTPPWYSTATPKTRLSAIWFRLVRSAPVASGLSTAPSSMPLPEMSVNTQPLMRLSIEPLPKSRPAAPRWTNASLVNWMWLASENETFAGSLVHAPYGQVPPGTSVHSPWTAKPLLPVMVYPAWISENPSSLLGREDSHGREVLPGTRDVEHCAAAAVEVPLPRCVQQLERVLDVRRRDARATRLRSGVAQPARADQVRGARRWRPVRLDDALVRVVPAGLAHRDGATGGNAPHRAARLGPGAEATGVDELEVADVAPARHGRAGRGVPGRGPRQSDRSRTTGAGGPHAVDVELAAVQPGRRRGRPDVAGGVDPLPAGDRHAAADDRPGASGGRPDHVVTAGTGVGRGQRERGRELVHPIGQLDPHVTGHVLVQAAHQLLGPAQRPYVLAP